MEVERNHFFRLKNENKAIKDSMKDTDEERVMNSKSDSREQDLCKADEVIKELFELLIYRYQTGIKTSMKGSDFIFDCVNLLHSGCHKINLSRGGPYIDPPDQIENKKAFINPISGDHKCFQYTAIVALNHEKKKRKNFANNVKNQLFFK